jgi:hypothetical protein
MTNPFVHVPEDKALPLTELNRRTQDIAAARRADLDVKHEQVQKAVAVAFERKVLKPVVPKASPMSNQLKATADAAAKVAAADKKA